MSDMTTTPAAELLSDDLVITDAGIETVLVFERGVDLPAFAAFPLLDQASGRRHLTEYMSDFVALADQHNAGLIIETPTWRANPDWVQSWATRGTTCGASRTTRSRWQTGLVQRAQAPAVH